MKRTRSGKTEPTLQGGNIEDDFYNNSRQNSEIWIALH